MERRGGENERGSGSFICFYSFPGGGVGYFGAHWLIWAVDS